MTYYIGLYNEYQKDIGFNFVRFRHQTIGWYLLPYYMPVIKPIDLYRSMWIDIDRYIVIMQEFWLQGF